MRKPRLPDGRRLCGYCNCYAPPWKLEKLPNGVARCIKGHGCQKAASDEGPKQAHPPRGERQLRPHVPGMATSVRLRVPHPADVFPFLEYGRMGTDGDSDR